MTLHEAHPDPRAEAHRLGARASAWGNVALGAGVVGLGASIALGLSAADHFRTLQRTWLVACAFFLTISLGAMFFVIIQHLTRAGWSVVVRRVAELAAANTPVLALLVAPLVVQTLRGDDGLYPWVDADRVRETPTLAAKAVFLDPRFFAARLALYFAIWWLVGRFLLARSTAQDTSNGVEPTLALERRAAPAMVAFALSLNFAAFDLVMSVSPTWYSTIFGVYVFAGSVMSFFAATVLGLRFLQSRGLLREEVTVEHYHDLGKFLFAFVFFWGYIAFSQFMLIWYADLPEETFWFQPRMEGTWGTLSLVLLFGHFVLPFAGLLSRHAKRRLAVLSAWAVWLLAMHALDLAWLVLPESGHAAVSSEAAAAHGVAIPWLQLAAAFLSVGGLWTFSFLRLARTRSLCPIGDPRLPQSLAFENF